MRFFAALRKTKRVKGKGWEAAIKKALITGITGQDGSYLAELLLGKGYEPNTRLLLHYGDLSDSEQISHLVYNIKPDEIYNLGAQSHVRVSFDLPEYTGNVTALGTTRLLEIVRETRKITSGIAMILAGKEEYLYLGNLDAERDWGYAPEYVEGMWRMLQSEQPDDYVIGTGESHSVKEFVDEAFGYVGLDPVKYVKSDQHYFRPTEVEALVADCARAKQKLGWTPKVKFKELVRIMVDADMRDAGLKPIGKGDEILKQQFSDRWWGPD